MLILIQLNVFPNENLMKYGNELSTSPSLGPYVGLKTQKLAKEIPPLVPIANPQLHYFTLGKVHIIFKLNTNQCYIVRIARVGFL